MKNLHRYSDNAGNLELNSENGIHEEKIQFFDKT